MTVPYTGKGCTASLGAALVIAKACNAHIELLHATPNPYSLLSDFLPDSSFGGEMFAEFASEANRQMESAMSVCTRIVGNAAVEFLDRDEVVAAPSACFYTAKGTLEELLVERSRASDLIIMNREGKEHKPSYRRLVRAALFRTGQPVLLVPIDKPIAYPVRKAVLAWNGSFEAARALKLALPFLARAHVVVYTGVEGESPSISAAEAVVYLKRHGIKAEAREEPLEETPETAIRRVVTSGGADLLVMGAYSRNERLREMLLGSFTGEILNAADIPVLMAN
jgi:nucleotide-binding universal stress UspA family protein